MGNTATTVDIGNFSDACLISSVTDSMERLGAVEKASEIQLFLNSRARYKGVPIQSALLRFWPTVSRHFYKRNYNELSVYKHILHNLVDFNICPNFQRYLGSSKNCHFDILNTIYVDKEKNKIPELVGIHVDLKAAGLEHYNDPMEITPEEIDAAKNRTYAILVTESSSRTTLGEYLFQLKEEVTDRKRPAGIVPQELLVILLQICFACYAMHQTGLVHSNLNIESVMIEKSKNQRVTYIMETHICSFDVHNIPKIINFRMAAMGPKLRDDSNINGSLSDFRHLLRQIKENFYPDAQADKTGELAVLMHMNDLPEIFKRISELVGYTTVLEENVYECSKNMFDAHGRVRLALQTRLVRKEILLRNLAKQKQSKEPGIRNVAISQEELDKQNVAQQKNVDDLAALNRELLRCGQLLDQIQKEKQQCIDTVKNLRTKMLVLEAGIGFAGGAALTYKAKQLLKKKKKKNKNTKSSGLPVPETRKTK